MTLKSRSLEESSEKSVALAAQHQAFVTSSSRTEDRFQATLRVPAPSLSPLMNSLSSVGKVTHSTLNLAIKRERIPGPPGAVTQGTAWFFGKLKHLN